MTSPEWVQAGFFLVSTRATPWRDNKILPDHAVTVSECVVDRYPDTSWLLEEHPGEETAKLVQGVLGLTPEETPRLFEWIDTAWETGDFGWPGVFLSLGAALEFQERFLHRLKPAVRLIGLSLDSALVSNYCASSDVLTQLLRYEPLESAGVPLGFDVAGETGEPNPTFHTFSCNGLEREFSEVVGVLFNEHGLIVEYADALAAWEFMDQLEPENEPEPAEWFPFRIDEHTPLVAG